MIDRRSCLKYAGLVPLTGAVPRLAFGAAETGAEKPDYTLRIGTGLVELAPAKADVRTPKQSRGRLEIQLAYRICGRPGGSYPGHG
jgi:hypothetical protein